MLAALALYRRPEYLHAVLNSFPTHGLLIGVVCLAAGLALRRRAVQVTGLAVIVAMCVMAWPVEHYGERGYDRVKAMSGDEAQAWLEAHAKRADAWMWVFAAAGGAGAAALVLPLRWRRLSMPLAALALAAALGAQAAGAWIAHAGGKVRHGEFRTGPP
jgi:hypothetical protein